MKLSLVQLTLRRWVEIATSGRFYLLVTGFIIAGALLGPFGTVQELSLFERLAISLQLNIMCWFFGVVIAVPTRLALQRVGVPTIASVCLSCAAAAMVIIPGWAYALGFLLNLTFEWHQLVEHAILFTALVIVITLALLGSRGAVEGHDSDGSGRDQMTFDISSRTPRDPDRCPLQSRLPKEKRGILYAMVAQDHYVEMITNKGSELVLMRLSDAADLANPQFGMRIHRSAWISLFGIEALSKNGRRRYVTLRNGRELPVARSSEQDLVKFCEGASDVDGLVIA